jgi:predicted ATP-grasp superfamily ATP-dependent carboligase
LSELVKIVEKKPIPSEVIMLYGLPDVGLVGLIATSYLISELNPEETAYMDSDLLPPVVVLHAGLPHAPLRVYGNKEFIAVISELAVPASALHTVMHA